MTKDELEKEARFRAKGWKEQENCVQAYIAGANPREKRIAELEAKIEKIRDYLAYKIPHELMNEATNKIWNMI